MPGVSICNHKPSSIKLKDTRHSLIKLANGIITMINMSLPCFS